MPKLFIIGNGFDLAHELDTSYWSFRNYLQEHAEDFLRDFEKLYGIYPFDEDDWHFMNNLEKVKQRRDESIKNLLWRDFENNLGEADDSSMLGFSESIVSSLDLDSGPVGIEDTLDTYWEEEYQFIEKLQNYIFEWAKQINLSGARPQKNSLIRNGTDYFFTFNYTSALETLYDIPTDRILHIHGGLPDHCFSEPIIGHGNIDKIREYMKEAEEANNHFDEGHTSICRAIVKFYQRQFKDTATQITLYRKFFAFLKDVDSVEIIGHSLGAVDIPYFIKIKESIRANADWIVYYYQISDAEHFKDILSSIGIDKGRITSIPISAFWKLQ